MEAYGYSMDLKGHKVTFTDNEAMTVKDFESGKAAWKLQNGIDERSEGFRRKAVICMETDNKRSRNRTISVS